MKTLTFLFAVLTAASLARGIENIPAFQLESRILFQGDSITDGNRGRTADPNHILGHGYVFILAAKYGAAFPADKLVFINRGISGNKVSDLAARWTQDTLALKPSLLSLLIGINDTSAHVDIKEYEAGYDRLLAETRAALPNVRLVLGEPFTLKVGKHVEDWETWRAAVAQRAEVVARLAKKYHAAFVPYQQAFDAACKRAPADYWIWDGIHPTYSGHQIMAEAWEAAVRDYWRE